MIQWKFLLQFHQKNEDPSLRYYPPLKCQEQCQRGPNSAGDHGAAAVKPRSLNKPRKTFKYSKIKYIYKWKAKWIDFLLKRGTNGAAEG